MAPLLRGAIPPIGDSFPRCGGGLSAVERVGIFIGGVVPPVTGDVPPIEGTVPLAAGIMVTAGGTASAAAGLVPMVMETNALRAAFMDMVAGLAPPGPGYGFGGAGGVLGVLGPLPFRLERMASTALPSGVVLPRAPAIVSHQELSAS